MLNFLLESLNKLVASAIAKTEKIFTLFEYKLQSKKLTS